MYAHATIEHPETGEKLHRGESVPDGFPGLEDLMEGGSVRDEPYDPDAEPKQLPDVVEIDGVVYRRAADGAEADDVRS